MTIGNPAFCLALYLTGAHFRGGLQYVGDVSGQKIKVWTNQNSRNRWCQIVTDYMQRCTNAHLKISLYVLIHKIIP